MAGRPYPPQRRPTGYPRPRPSSSSDGGLLPAVLGIALVGVVVIFVLNKAGVSFGGGTGSGGAGAEQAKPSYGSAILAEAKKHDAEPYVMGGGHPPKGYGGGGLDCSGLINVAVLAATGVNEDRLAQDFKDSKHWLKIGFAEAKTGDIMYRLWSRDPGGYPYHVVIVVDNGGDGSLTLFEAQSQNTGILTTRNNHYSDFDGALRFAR